MIASRKVLVLLSGGLDSSTCVAFFSNKKLSVSTVFIDLGQASAKRERLAARKIAKHYKTKHLELILRGAKRKRAGEVQARNAFLLMAALMESGANVATIAIGIHAGVRYYDSTPAFMSAAHAIIAAYTDGRVRAVAPLASMSKAQVWELAKDLKVPLGHTYSCQSGTLQPCGNCESCRDRGKLHEL